jgi:hypothetical protein
MLPNSEDLSRLVFRMALNDEISAEDQANLLWSSKTLETSSSVDPRPTLYNTDPEFFSPDSMVETVSRIIDRSSMGADRNLPLSPDAALPKTEYFKVILREKKTAMERKIQQTILHISTRRAVARLEKFAAHYIP